MTPAELGIIGAVFFATSLISVVTGATSLITVPTLLLFGVEPRTAVATNMLALTWLSAGATLPFLRTGNVDRTRLPALLILTVLSSGIGALLLFFVAAEALPLFIAVMMIVIAGFVILNPHAGVDTDQLPTTSQVVAGYVSTFCLGIYGGFFSGGYVTMLTAAWVALFRMPFRLAVGTSKLINIASCLIAVAVFAFQGAIDWSLGSYLSIVMFLGGIVGARVAIWMNDIWLRRVFLCAVLLLAAKTLVSEFSLAPLFRTLVGSSGVSFKMTEQVEAAMRLGTFVGVLIVMALWELLAPRRERSANKPLRWASNLGLVVVSTIVLRVVAPLGAVGVAIFAESNGWGIFNLVTLPPWFRVLASVILLDCAIYLQHVMFHAVPLFWRLHMVHHADHDVDVSTGLRFHTAEILLSLGIKAGIILLLGAPAVAVLIFEVLLNATSMFNHSNVAMPLGIERMLRWLVVTPDMHRVHHSHYANETNSNFGFNLPWWDRLFGTYRDQPVDGHLDMQLGLDQFPDKHKTSLLTWMLLIPFVGDAGKYPINRRKSIKEERASHTVGDNPTSIESAVEKAGCKT